MLSKQSFYIQLLKGQCLVTQKAPVWSSTVLVAYVCLHKHTVTSTVMCTKMKNESFLKWRAWWSTMRASGWITHNTTSWWQIIRAFNRREGGRNTESCCGKIKIKKFNHFIECKGCVKTQWKIGHSTKSYWDVLSDHLSASPLCPNILPWV